MRILHWHELEREAGGAESMLRDLTNGLQGLGHEVAWWHNAHIQQAVDEFKPDIVQIWTINNMIPIDAVNYLLENKVKSVWALMNYWPFCGTNIMLKNGDESCNAVTGACDGQCQTPRAGYIELINQFPVLALNRYSAEIYKRNGLRCDYVAELGIDTELFKPDEFKREAGTIYTSCAWPNYPHKGMRYLLDTGYDVRLLTNMSRAQVAENLKHADVYVFPSTYEETWGLCLTEAMASGCVCITTDNAGGKAQITDGVNGIIVPKHDAQAIKNTITSLKADIEFRRKLGNAAREHVVKDHGLNAMALRFEKVYNRVVGVMPLGGGKDNGL
jgi:hypothetical protein